MTCIHSLDLEEKEQFWCTLEWGDAYMNIEGNMVQLYVQPNLVRLTINEAV